MENTDPECLGRTSFSAKSHFAFCMRYCIYAILLTCARHCLPMQQAKDMLRLGLLQRSRRAAVGHRWISTIRGTVAGANATTAAATATDKTTAAPVKPTKYLWYGRLAADGICCDVLVSPISWNAVGVMR